MLAVEAKKQSLPTSAYFLRTAISPITKLLLRSEVRQPESQGGMTKLESLVQAGHGAIVLSNHFSMREPFTILSALLENKVIRKKTIVIPIGIHQYYLGMGLTGKLFGIILCPVFAKKTEAFIKKINKVPEELKNKPEKKSKLSRLFSPLKNLADAGKRRLILFLLPELNKTAGASPEKNRSAYFFSYINKGVEAVNNGDILLGFPQGERESKLESLTPMMQVIFKKTSKKAGFNNFAVSFLGVGITGVEDYGDKSIRGLNLRFSLPGQPRYELEIGETLTDQEFSNKASVYKLNEDELSREQMLLVAPKPYRPRDSLLLTALRYT